MRTSSVVEFLLCMIEPCDFVQPVSTIRVCGNTFRSFEWTSFLSSWQSNPRVCVSSALFVIIDWAKCDIYAPGSLQVTELMYRSQLMAVSLVLPLFYVEMKRLGVRRNVPNASNNSYRFLLVIKIPTRYCRSLRGSSGRFMVGMKCA